MFLFSNFLRFKYLIVIKIDILDFMLRAKMFGICFYFENLMRRALIKSFFFGKLNAEK